MSSSTAHIHSTRMNHGMLRSRGMQRLKSRSMLNGLGEKRSSFTRPATTHQHERRMKKAVARSIRREIIGYLSVISSLLILAAMFYALISA